MADTVVIAEDHHLTRTGIQSVIEDQLGGRVVASTQDGLDVVALLEEHEPELLVLDLGLPHLNGLTILRTIQEKGLSVRVVVFSMHGDLEYVRQAFALGAAGYVLKGAPMEELTIAVEAARAGERYVSNDLPQHLTETDEAPADAVDAAYERLTQREREVLELTAAGYTSQEVGEQLYISHRTVEKHRENIKKKLNLRNVVEMADYAYEHDLIPMTPELGANGSVREERVE